jgi:hypothetical protein
MGRISGWKQGAARMTQAAPRLLDLDWARFDPWRIQAVEHHLVEHPLLRHEPLVELGRRLEARGKVRTHSNTATAGTPFNTAPSLHPNARSAADTLTGIGAAAAWMSLLNVQSDPIYRQLVDELLDDVAPQVELRDPGMCYRGGWIFVTSPRTVTPFHIDKEHNFILQIRGSKTVYVWDHTDTEVVSERARDLFHARHERDLIVWRDEFRQRAHVFKLEPGQGAYMPSTSPHMVENGDGPSVTMSFTYYTAATRRDALLHNAHYKLRTWGLEPAPVGRRPLLDALTASGVRSLRALKALRRSLMRMPEHSDGARYAHAD